MSIKTIFAATAVAAVTVGAFLSLGSSPAAAQTGCHYVPALGHIRCTNNGATHANNNGAPAPRCYFLPTTANGAVNGLRKVCS